jgi:hypothetical protein
MDTPSQSSPEAVSNSLLNEFLALLALPSLAPEQVTRFRELRDLIPSSLRGDWVLVDSHGLYRALPSALAAQCVAQATTYSTLVELFRVYSIRVCRQIPFPTTPRKVRLFVFQFPALAFFLQLSVSMYGHLNGWPYARVVAYNSAVTIVAFFVVCSQLNGNNGEATNTDDMQREPNPRNESAVAMRWQKHKYRALAFQRSIALNLVQMRDIEQEWLTLADDTNLDRAAHRADLLLAFSKRLENIPRLRGMIIRDRARCYRDVGDIRSAWEEDDLELEWDIDDYRMRFSMPPAPLVRPQLNGNNGEATNADDLAAMSAVISSMGGHVYEIDNSSSHRREEIAHATPAEIRAAASRMTRRRTNPVKVRAIAEREHQRKQDTSKAKARLEKSLRELSDAMSYDSNQPQIGFNMEELVRRLTDLCPDKVKELAASVSAFAGGIKRAADASQFVSDTIDTVAAWMPSLMRTAVLCLVLGTFVYAIRNNNPALAVLSTTVLTGMAAMYGFSVGFITADMIHRLDAAIKRGKANVNEAQGSETVSSRSKLDPLIPIDDKTVSAMFVSLFSASFLAFGDKKKGYFNLLKDFLVHFPATIKGIDQVTEFASKVVLSLLNHFREKFGFVAYESILSNTSPFASWAADVEAFLDRHGNRSLTASPMHLGQINAYINEGREHMSFVRAVTEDAGLRARMSKIMVDLAAARDDCLGVNPNVVAARPKPVCLYLYGPAGLGKSHFAEMAAHSFLKSVLDPLDYALFLKHPEAWIYHRTPETQFWDGYAGQFVCIFDDFGQKCEVPGGDSVYMDIIRCLNGAPALLHMASLRDKGASYFKSAFVICTANIECPVSPAIYCKEAVQRRPDFYVNVKFHEELLTNSTIVGEKCVHGDLLAAFNAKPTWAERASVYNLRRYEIERGSDRAIISPQCLDPAVLMNDIVQKHHRNVKTFRHELPPLPPGTVQETEVLKAKFLARQQGRPEPQSVLPQANVEPIVPPPPKLKTDYPEDNHAQVFDRNQFSLNKDFVTDLSEYIHDIINNGEDSPLTKEHREQLQSTYLDPAGASWLELEDAYEALFSVARAFRARAQAYREINAQTDFDPELSKVSTKTYILSLFQDWATKLRKAASEVFDFFYTHWKWVLGGCMAISVGLCLVKAISSWSSVETQAESFASRTRSAVQRKEGFAIFKRNMPGPRAPVNNGQTGDSMQQQAIKCLRHVYHVMWTRDDICTIGQVTMLFQETGVTNAHMCDIIKSHVATDGITHVWFRKFGNLSQAWQIPVTAFTQCHRDPERDPHLDMVMVTFPSCGLPTAPDLRKHIPSLSDFANRSQLNVLVPEMTDFGAHLRFLHDSRAALHGGGGPYVVPGDGQDTTYTNGTNISYVGKTIRGQCGVPIITDSLSQGKYLPGIHKCGNGIVGSAAILVSEWVDEEVEWLRVHSPTSDLSPGYTDDVMFTANPTNVSQCFPGTTLGVTKPFHGAQETALVPLPHAHMFDLNTAPATMTVTKVAGEWISPYYKNRSEIPEFILCYPDVPDLQYLLDQVILNKRALEAADLTFWRRRMTFEEAVFGIPGTPFAGLDMTTSVGYPWVLTGKTNKGAWLQNPTGLEIVRREVDRKLTLLQAGSRPLFLNMDVLKDERRTIEKATTCNTRVVVVGPMDLLILNRMFFGGYATWRQINRIQNGTTCGMNPYLDEFDSMCRELFKPNHKVFGGDRRKFDLNQHPVHLKGLFKSYNKWYGDLPDNHVRYILSQDFLFARHVTFPTSVSAVVRAELMAKAQAIFASQRELEVPMCVKIVNASDNKQYAFIYEKVGGHPSGSFLTTVVNSDDSVTEPFIALQFEIRNVEVVLESLYSKEVVPQTLGDDFLCSVGHRYQQHLNALTFARFSMLYGMQVTREDKSAITEAFPNDEPIFLKRLCYYNEDIGRYVGALSISAIIDAMCWARKATSSQLELIQLFDGALRELSLHGPKVYAEYAPKVGRAATYTLRQLYDPAPWRKALSQLENVDHALRP